MCAVLSVHGTTQCSSPWLHWPGPLLQVRHWLHREKRLDLIKYWLGRLVLAGHIVSDTSDNLHYYIFNIVLVGNCALVKVPSNNYSAFSSSTMSKLAAKYLDRLVIWNDVVHALVRMCG